MYSIYIVTDLLSWDLTRQKGGIFRKAANEWDGCLSSLLNIQHFDVICCWADIYVIKRGQQFYHTASKTSFILLSVLSMKNVVKNVKKKLIICGFLFFQLGTCVSRDAHPPATLTWKKNGKPLTADGKSKSSPVCGHAHNLSLQMWRCNIRRPPGGSDVLGYYIFTWDNSFNHGFRGHFS